MAMENPPFEDVFPIQDGDFPLLCLFTGGYHPLLKGTFDLQQIHDKFWNVTSDYTPEI